MAPVDERGEWADLEISRAALAVIEEGRRHKWTVKPRETTTGAYIIRIKPALAAHFKYQEEMTRRTASQVIVQAYVTGNRPPLVN